MKKYLSVILLSVFLVCLFGVQEAHAISDLAYLVDINGTSFLPSTIHAGDIVSMAVNISNKGQVYPIIDLNGSIEVGPQFELVDSNYNVPPIGPGSNQTLVFKFHVKDNTSSGYYSVFLNMSYLRDGGLTTEDRTITVPVSKTEKNIDVTVSPVVINPGNQTELVFTLNNMSGASVSNISLSWSESSNLILPIGSDNKRYVSYLEPGKKQQVSYTVAADPGITTGVYPLDVNLTFTDSSGVRNQSSKVGIIAGGATDFEISAELSNGQLSVSIANIGSNNASATVVKIPQQRNIAVQGSNISILGALNKGDYTIATFSVQATQSDRNFTRQAVQSGTAAQPSSASQGGATQAGGFPAGDRNSFSAGLANSVIVEIDYTDTTGERQVVQKTVQLASSASSGLVSGISGTGNFGSRQQANQLSFVPWVLLAAIAAGAAYFNRARAKKEWKHLLVVLAIIAVIFLVVIFLLNAELVSSVVATVVSIALLAAFFRTNIFDAIAGRVFGENKKKAI